MLFRSRRYQLSPSVDADRFSAQGLHDAISGSLDALSGSAGMLLKGIFLRDPTGETLSIVGQFTGDSQPSSEGGAWASPDGRRALLLVQTVAPGSDTDAQALAIARIRQAFERIPDRGADSHLVMSGTGVFSVLSRGIIEREVSLLATASTVLVVGLLLWVYQIGRAHV